MLSDSRSILKRLASDGQSVVRTRGSHHVLSHPTRAEIIVIPHPKKDIPIGTMKAIYRQAGWDRD